MFIGYDRNWKHFFVEVQEERGKRLPELAERIAQLLNAGQGDPILDGLGVPTGSPGRTTSEGPARAEDRGL